MSNWKICLYINPDEDFYYAKAPGFERLTDYNDIYLDATVDNVERVIEQLLLAASTVDTKDYLKDELEPALVEVFTDAAECFQRELCYHSATGNWIDFTFYADFGNQSVKIGLAGDDNIDYDWAAWDAAFPIEYSGDVSYRNERALLDDLLAMIETGEAGDFDAFTYTPNETGWSSLSTVVEMLPEYDEYGNRVG